ncbi:MAG: pseudouridine synthase [Saprospiraceae bacterium]
MAVRNTLQYLLIRSLKISKKQAKEILESGQIILNKSPVYENRYFEKTDHVEYQNQLLFEPFKSIKVLYYKPRGVECTMNANIPNNLAENLAELPRLFPIGRLDKESEGLLLLTNDGKLYRELNHYDSDVEKEYLVQVNNPIDDHFLEQMSSGVEIMGKTTLPCIVEKIDTNTFSIILKQGLNRQIRRMCYKLGYEVTSLKRIRIGQYQLNALQVGEWKII